MPSKPSVPQILLQWRWKLVLSASGVNAIENNMPTINQEKICVAIFRWIVLSLSSFPTNWAIYTGNAITATTEKDCHYNHKCLFFSWNHSLKWLGKRAVNEWGGTWIVLRKLVTFLWPPLWEDVESMFFFGAITDAGMYLLWSQKWLPICAETRKSCCFSTFRGTVQLRINCKAFKCLKASPRWPGPP